MSVKDIKEIEIRYSTSSNPTSQDNFQTALNNVTVGLSGQRCISGPDFSALGLEEGQNITMQFYYQSGPRSAEHFEVRSYRVSLPMVKSRNANLLKCADLTLVSTGAFTEGNWDTNCVNWVRSTQMKRVSASNPGLFALQEEEAAAAAATPEATASSSDHGLTAVEAGVTGAMVTLGVIGIALAVSVCAGFMTFGKRLNRAPPAIGKPASFSSSVSPNIHDSARARY